MNVTFDTGGYTLPGSASGTRRKLVFMNTGATTIFWGWKKGMTAAGAHQGIPLAPGATVPFGDGMVLDGNDRINTPVYFQTASTGSLNWEELE